MPSWPGLSGHLDMEERGASTNRDHRHKAGDDKSEYAPNLGTALSRLRYVRFFFRNSTVRLQARSDASLS
jgi:hypothetical protein